MVESTEKIVLNVGGMRYETYCSTLRAFPGTKLHSLTEPEASMAFDYDPDAKEFFFDRSPRLFQQVLSYFRTRHLHYPVDVCRSALEEELAFWEIRVSQLPPCCWTKLSKMEDQAEECNAFGNAEEPDDNQGLLSQEERRNGHRWMHWKLRVWTLLEKPYSSLWATALAILSLLLNIGLVILTNVNSTTHFLVSNDNVEDGFHHYGHRWAFLHKRVPHLLYLELFFILLFACEFFLRLTVCPNKKKFLRRPLNAIDFLSLFPIFIELFSAGHLSKDQAIILWLGLFRAVYILKLLRVFRLVETPLMLRVLPYMAKAILKEIFLFMVIFVFEVLFFGSLCYYAEIEEAYTHMDDVTSGLWWATITLTTVGYGDMYPFTKFGQVVGACAAITGVLTVIILTTILLVKFKGFYEAAVAKEKRKSMKRQAA
ncbi:potassium voltage-gated channel subfamily C member 1-like [Sceloporus undulatus]|uniref:potassium voltage-gated channel subfamily C member 1-like n=1 Tax=Sceloporus undulatus TaxID=8520 RepID=UPI001C4C413F|nr:potassium voltage-gated channel subfamily C member 1-like [Sceloporus undulatus]XP_042333821.1 potassium voltage-gated channel subfamily C member 1-like [Sceloporus undulatus]